jgi:hypothetical protein
MHVGWHLTPSSRGAAQQIQCVGRAKYFAADLGPVLAGPETHPRFLTMNPCKTATGAAAKGLVKIIRDELARAQTPLPGLSQPDMDALCRCANPRCPRQVDGKNPRLFARSRRSSAISTVSALWRARENFSQMNGSNPEPCRLLCDQCAGTAASRGSHSLEKRSTEPLAGDAS